MQSGEDARRVIDIGARPESVHVTGNMKYDRRPEPVELPEVVHRWKEDHFLLVAGSTHAGEEAVVLDALNGMEGEKLRVALVPRHPERFDQVAGLLRQKGHFFERFSSLGGKERIESEILLVDAMGVLDGFYALSDAAFVGGSLVPVGGHNLLEPAMHGVPVLTGPHLYNFREIARLLIHAGACLVADDGKALISLLRLLSCDEDRRKRMGEAARTAYEGRKGASVQNCREIMYLVDENMSPGEPDSGI
jgi:3-deoxy-D-manno-octulosonic-acid transferase